LTIASHYNVYPAKNSRIRQGNGDEAGLITTMKFKVFVLHITIGTYIALAIH